MRQDNLDILKTISRVEVPDLLYHKIETRIEKNREKIVPLYKVSIAASLVLGLILSQWFIVDSFSNNENHFSNDIELIEVNNNSLYYE